MINSIAWVPEVDHDSAADSPDHVEGVLRIGEEGLVDVAPRLAADNDMRIDDLDLLTDQLAVARDVLIKVAGVRGALPATLLDVDDGSTKKRFLSERAIPWIARDLGDGGARNSLGGVGPVPRSPQGPSRTTPGRHHDCEWLALALPEVFPTRGGIQYSAHRRVPASLRAP